LKGTACECLLKFPRSSHSLSLALTNRRPGILVLVNDADWELEGELEYELKDRDEIVFISTLHGG
jgi:hypothetical protein